MDGSVKFIDVLHRGRRRQPNWRLQENIARYSMYPPHGNVKAAPVKPPVKDDKR